MEEENRPKPQPIDMSWQEFEHTDGLTADHFFELRTYLAKKEKVAANQEANQRRIAKLNSSNELGENSRDDSKERTPGKSEGNAGAVRYSKEKSHCLERNNYIIPRKVQTDKLPEQIKEMLHIDEETINDEKFIERNCELHETYMANLREIREGIEREQQEKLERQRQIENMMNFKKARGSGAAITEQHGSIETLEKDQPVEAVAEENDEENAEHEEEEAAVTDRNESGLRIQS